MTEPLAAIMQREMSRKEFIATLGFGVASILGLSSLVKLLSGKSIDTHLTHRSTQGYGSTAYGGGKE